MCVCAPACCNSTGTKTKLKARKEASLHNLQATHNSRASTVVCRVLDPPPPFPQNCIEPPHNYQASCAHEAMGSYRPAVTRRAPLSQEYHPRGLQGR